MLPAQRRPAAGEPVVLRGHRRRRAACGSTSTPTPTIDTRLADGRRVALRVHTGYPDDGVGDRAGDQDRRRTLVDHPARARVGGRGGARHRRRASPRGAPATSWCAAISPSGTRSGSNCRCCPASPGPTRASTRYADVSRSNAVRSCSAPRPTPRRRSGHAAGRPGRRAGRRAGPGRGVARGSTCRTETPWPYGAATASSARTRAVPPGALPPLGSARSVHHAGLAAHDLNLRTAQRRDR